MRTTALLLCILRSIHTSAGDLSPLFGEDVCARLWRTALTGPPALWDRDGWPHYTEGAHNNTPQKYVLPGTYVNYPASGWTSGFFPDSLWQAYRRRVQLTDDAPLSSCQPSTEQWLSMAKAWTHPLQTNANLTNTHDLGFLAKPFESAMQIQQNDEYLPVLKKMSMNLAARFEPGAGVIRSWDCGSFASASCVSDDSVLVIIDNMMNLALLARSAQSYTKNSTLLDIARSHADSTMANHVRSDGSSFHVCDYSATTGDVYQCRTAQGLADDSTWARGQAWGIYGFAEFFSLTGELKYLETSKLMADWFIHHLPEDGLPFWDFNAPYEPVVTPRDSSAATIAASGMMLLQEQLEKRGHGYERQHRSFDYRKAAVGLLEASVDLALAGEITFADMAIRGAETDVDTPANTSATKGFESILMHGTSNNNPQADPPNYDTGLVYGDYYLVEAGNRLLLSGHAF
ncbi:hypothetical protein KC343_g823 [Hortaea werneckii]|uniref:Uncharacterized protein n=1 Tax=Hortaea werneckii TaxID=91943 RepID=A0A3M7GVQ8_HORWE|nr:hypothetical protein KC346_g7545 [Hortaea werneckii]KAI7637224.1 hypothetical protein KC343_g823 [Hortaea werneckii]KAI7672575.1 hypothetical protein KC319_g5277 [Hortaea werneckii]RMZ05119.1 hypothetical protein D0864_02574 [Hortaea werneckii]